MKIKADVLVVGGGPSGTTAARYLADAKLEVILVERNNELGKDIRCAEGLDLPTIEDVVGEISEHLISIPIDKIIIDYKGDRIRANSPGHGVILERYLFDKYLGQLAARSGSKIMLGCHVTDLKKDKDRWIATGIQGDEEVTFETKAIVAADGVDSAIGRLAGIDTSIFPRDLYSCSEVKGDLTGCEEDGALLIALDEDLFTGGYAWSFPKAGHIGNIGLGIRGDAGGDTAACRLETWLKRDYPNMAKLSYLVGCVPVKKMERMSAEGILIVGDAARLADPLSGGGIGPALTSAKLASEILIKLFKKNELDKTHIYDKAWWNGEGKEFEQRMFLRNVYISNDKKLLPVVFQWGKKNLDGRTIETFSANEMLLSLIKSVPQLFKLASSIVPTLMKLVFKR